jgi:hypothetical protein
MCKEVFSANNYKRFKFCECFLLQIVKTDAWYRTVNTVLTYARIIGSNSLLLPLSMSSKQWQCTGIESAVHMRHVTYRVSLLIFPITANINSYSVIRRRDRRETKCKTVLRAKV